MAGPYRQRAVTVLAGALACLSMGSTLEPAEAGLAASQDSQLHRSSVALTSRAGVSYGAWGFTARSNQQLARTLKAAMAVDDPSSLPGAYSARTAAEAAALNPPHPRRPYTVTAQQLDPKAVNKPGGASPLRASAAAPEVMANRLDYCTAMDRAGEAAGWIRDRYLGCRRAAIVMNKVDRRTGRELGRIGFIMTQAVVPSKGARTAAFGVRVTDILTQDELSAPGVSLGANLICAPMDASTCAVTRPQAARTVNGWRTNRDYFPLVNSTGGAAPDSKAFMKFNVRFDLVDIEGADSLAAPANELRCDSAGYGMVTSGCILDETIPALGLDVADENVDEAALHIWDAISGARETYPIIPSGGTKYVPGWLPTDAYGASNSRLALFPTIGAPRNNGPLHRLYYDKPPLTKSANRQAAVAECTKHWGAGYAQGGLYSCDEYPLRVTKEGAANGDLNWSARVIRASDNSNAGTAVSQFFASERVLDDDAFGVNVYCGADVVVRDNENVCDRPQVPN